MKAHVILLIGEQKARREGEKKERPSAGLWCEHLFSELSFTLQGSYPQSRAGMDPCDIALFEELREVVGRQGKANAYYIRLIRLKGWEKEREGDRQSVCDPVEKCFVVLWLDWAPVGHRVKQQSPEYRWLLTALAPCAPCTCVCLCICAHRTAESPSLRALGEGQEEAAAKYGQMTEHRESSSLSLQPLWQVRSVSESNSGLRHAQNNMWSQHVISSHVVLCMS